MDFDDADDEHHLPSLECSKSSADLGEDFDGDGKVTAADTGLHDGDQDTEVDTDDAVVDDGTADEQKTLMAIQNAMDSVGFDAPVDDGDDAEGHCLLKSLSVVTLSAKNGDGVGVVAFQPKMTKMSSYDHSK